jgi:hypothetical protein
VYDRRLKRDCALKIVVGSPEYFSEQEILTMCRLTGLPGFVSIYDYWVCSTLPSAIRFGEEMPNPTYYCMVMDLLPGTWSQALAHALFQSRSELHQFYFEMVYSLNEARVSMGFIHGDISTKNVLYRVNNQPRHYVLGSTGLVVLCDSSLQPIWSDFGESQFSAEEVVDPDDRQQLLKLMRESLGLSLDDIRQIKLDTTYNTLMLIIRDRLMKKTV